MSLYIKNYEREDKEQLGQLLHICLEDNSLQKILDSPRVKLSYLAYVEKQLVGILIAWTNEFHPYCTYLKILSHPLFSKKNIEESLLSKVESEVEYFPLQMSIWETSTKLQRVLESSGFKEIRRTFMPTLNVSENKNVVTLNTQENQNIKSIAEIVCNEELINKLAGIVKRNYQQAHLANPVAERSLETWKKMILSKDLIPNGSYVYLDEEKNIIAYSFLHESYKQRSFELGWCGSSNSQNGAYIINLVMRQIRYAIDHDIHSIIGEFDNTDENAMAILKHFPFGPSTTLITYQKREI